MYSSVFCYDYNWTVLLITLILLYIELKDKNKELSLNFKQELFLRDISRKYSIIQTINRVNFSSCIYRI